MRLNSWNRGINGFGTNKKKIAINEMEEIIFSRGKDKCETWEDTLFTFEGIYHYDGFFLSKIRNLHPDTYLSTADKNRFMNDYKYIIVKEKGDLKRKGIEDLSIGSIVEPVVLKTVRSILKPDIAFTVILIIGFPRITKNN